MQNTPSLADIVGFFAMAASLAISLLGLPRQIWRNYKTRTSGLDPLLVYAATVSYTLWSIYAVLNGDMYLGIAQTAGAFFAWILLFQLFSYRDKKSVSRETILQQDK